MFNTFTKIVFFTLFISKAAFSAVDSAQLNLTFNGTQNDGKHDCSLMQRDGVVTVNYEVDLGLNKARSKWTEVEKTFAINEAFQAGNKLMIQDRTTKITINTKDKSATSYHVQHGKQFYFKTVSCSNQ